MNVTLGAYINRYKQAKRMLETIAKSDYEGDLFRRKMNESANAIVNIVTSDNFLTVAGDLRDYVDI